VSTGSAQTEKRISAAVFDAISRPGGRTAVVATDLQGRIEYVNPAAERMTGYSSTDLIGRSLAILVEPTVLRRLALAVGASAGFEAVVASLRDGATIDRQDWILRSKAGRRTPASVTLTAARQASGEILKFVAVVEDVSEYRRAEEVLHGALEREQGMVDELRALDEMRSHFAITASHELRTPVSSVLGFTEVLLNGEAGELTAQQRDMLERVDRNGQRLQTLVEDLLELCEASAPPPTHRSLVRVGDIVADALTIHHSQISGRDLEVAFSCRDPDTLVLADSDQLRRAISHLVSNAIKFTPSGGTVRLDVERADGTAVIRVSDTGVGIPADEVGSVFDHFFRSSVSRRYATQGAGVGLSIAKAIIVAHHGTIDATSVAGQGTVVTVALPLGKQGRGPT
jgi:PAS domain S-box-containing protein